MAIVPCRNHKSVAARSCGYVAIFNGHALSGLVQQRLLFGENQGYRNIEAVHAPLQSVQKSSQPCLQSLPLVPIFGSNPISQLCDDYGAGVATILLLFKPRNDPGGSVPLSGLANDVGVENPLHNLRRRAGRSSGLTG